MPPRRPIVPRRPRRPPVELPTIEPIRPVRKADPFDHPDWVFEPKYDGFRGLAYLTPDACTLRSRNDNLFLRFEDLGCRLREQLSVRSAILDGEVIALDDAGRPSFNQLMRRSDSLVFAVFDLLWLNGRDLRGLPLTRRKRLLDGVVHENTATVIKVMSVANDGTALFRAVQQLDMEGIVAKRRTDVYAAETLWYKILNPAYSQKEGRFELFSRGR